MVVCPKCGSGSGLRRMFYLPNSGLTEEFLTCDDCGEGSDLVFIDPRPEGGSK